MVDFFQICYKPEHEKQVCEWATVYFNDTLTQFFENQIIAELVPQSKADKIAVLSWAINHKRRTMNTGNREPIKREDLSKNYDIAVFTRNTPVHQMLDAMYYWHKGSKELLKEICLEVGVKWSSQIKYPIYQNAFCARREIYQEYVSTALIPAMKAMDTKFKERCWQDSGYYKLKQPGDDYAARVKQFLGVDYCPLHPFILERLFSVWINTRNFNVIYV